MTQADVMIANESKQTKNRGYEFGWSRFYITVEPVMFVVAFIIHFTSGITIDLLQQSVCYQNFNMSFEDCGGELSEDIKSDIEALTADLNMVNNLLQGIFPVLLVLCVGPWSDINGRKPFMLWGTRGFIAFYLLWGIMSFFPKIPVMCFVIPAIPLSLSGGWVSILISVQSFTSDIWHDELRPFRISLNIASNITGGLVANALVTQIFYAAGSAGYPVCYFICAGLAILLHVYVSFIIKESVNRTGKRTRLLDFAHLKTMLTVLILKPIRGRIVSYLTLIILATEITSSTGESSLVYLIGKSAFNWTLGDYNLYVVVTTIIGAICPVVGVYIFKKKLKIHSYILIAVFAILMLTFNLLKSFSTSETIFWVGAALLKVVSIIGPCIDAEISMIVKDSDMGKAFAFSSLIDALSPVVAIPLFTELYKYLLPDRTLKMFFLASGFSAVTAISSTMLLLKRQFSKNEDFTAINPEEKESMKA